MTTHTYSARLTWSGSTGAGYHAYNRSHQIVPAEAPGFAASADQAFGGDPELVNPEQLLLAAASSCQLLSFLAVAARSGVDVLAYADEATAQMPDDERPVRITRIVLRPRITVRGTDPAEVERLLRKAHDACYVANTLAVPVALEPVVEVVA